MSKDKALWFSRHKPTVEQLEELNGFKNTELIFDDDVTALASLNIVSYENAEEIYMRLADYCVENSVKYLVGVIPVPLRAVFINAVEDFKLTKRVWILESFNVNRSKEGEKPSFQHKNWMRTGIMYV